MFGAAKNDHAPRHGNRTERREEGSREQHQQAHVRLEPGHPRDRDAAETVPEEGRLFETVALHDALHALHKLTCGRRPVPPQKGEAHRDGGRLHYNRGLRRGRGEQKAGPLTRADRGVQVGEGTIGGRGEIRGRCSGEHSTRCRWQSFREIIPSRYLELPARVS